MSPPTWYSPSQMWRFKKEQISWLCEHYDILKDGCWPPKQSGYIDGPFLGTVRVKSSAYFEDAASILAEFHLRLDKCGNDGYLFKAIKCYGYDKVILYKIAHKDEAWLEHRISRVLRYITGRRKRRTYKEFCGH